MVGIGGRSKACDNCRQRRVKCDLTRPACLRCRKRRLQCGGPQDIAIIPYKDQSHAVVSSSNTERTSVMNNSPCCRVATTLSIPHDAVYISYTHTHLLDGNEAIVLRPSIDRSITSECFLALSTTYFGIKHRQKWIVTCGLSRYGGAIRSVHEALAKDDASRSFDVLEAVMIMAVIEGLISEREDGWINHARGLEKLLERQGPQRMTSLPSLVVLERCRATMIFAAIVLRKTTIVAKPEWKALPWVQYPGRLHSLKRLIDILADCPELFVLRERTEQPLKTLDDHQSQMQTLLSKTQAVLNGLHHWEHGWRYGVNDAYTEVEAPETTPVVLDRHGMPTPAWSTIFRYKSLYHASCLTIYHATLILVLRFLDGLNVALHQIRNAGLIICRSVDYHLTQTWTEVGAVNLLFPLRMAFEAMGREAPAIGTWLRTALDDISAGRRGLWKSAKAVLEL
ncbi:hypothetical protein EK21DRAFT_98575 [Setomelanomma holmii]|uniref:Zn(2)-C6 fungal-type domain-containing protein n=1 Tax=Setomelanomma holmii TaxID=210430 RepID=A0A9P4HG62_9PLEO|nr:hypothetical protein EK21DRAFT_98575 [Setomelanomma holmii]